MLQLIVFPSERERKSLTTQPVHLSVVAVNTFCVMKHNPDLALSLNNTPS